MQPIILASGSQIRADLLSRARVSYEVQKPSIDEHSVKDSMLAEGASPRDIADALAQAKARKVASKNPGRLVLGSDQILDLDGEVLSKPESEKDAVEQLRRMRGRRHTLLSAAVIFEDQQPVWRHVGQVRMYMRDLSDQWIESYVDRNWSSIKMTVGCYKLEEEGARLFTRVDGDYFNVLGLPLLELLSYLTIRGTLSS